MTKMFPMVDKKNTFLSGFLTFGMVFVSLFAQSRYVHAQTQKQQRHGASLSAGQQVALSSQPGSDLEATARRLNSSDLATAARHKEIPLVLVGSAPLSPGGKNVALFVQVQSASLCGSAGCSTDVYLKKGNEWVKILDSISGPVTVLPRRHGGMYDIVVDNSDRWIWKNGTYHDTLRLTDGPPVTRPVAKKRHEVQTGLRG